jgi:hypothetical protein
MLEQASLAVTRTSPSSIFLKQCFVSAVCNLTGYCAIQKANNPNLRIPFNRGLDRAGFGLAFAAHVHAQGRPVDSPELYTLLNVVGMGP